MPLPLPPGWEKSSEEMWDEIRKHHDRSFSNTYPRPSSDSASPSATRPPVFPGLSDELAALRHVDESALLAATHKPGMFSQMGTAFADTVKDPSSWGTVAKNFGKGALSGATLGLSEFVPDLQPDKESWAGTVGDIVGMAPTAMGGAGLVGRLGVKAGSKFLQKQLVKDAIAGSVMGVAQPRIRDAIEGNDENRNVIADAALGAAIPVAGGAVLAGAKRLLGIKPPIKTLGADAPSGRPGDSRAYPGAGLSPQVQKDLDHFIKTGQGPASSLPSPPANASLIWDTAPIAHGEPLVTSMGQEISYLRPGLSEGKIIAKDEAGLTRAFEKGNVQRSGQPPTGAAPPTPPTGPTAEAPLGGSPGPSPASTPPVDVKAPTIWSTVKDKARQLTNTVNLPIRVLSKDIDMATPEGQLVNATMNAAEKSNEWVRQLENAYQLKAPKGIKGVKTLWDQMDGKARLYWRDALAANQGDEAGALAQLAQYPDQRVGQIMQQFTQNWNKADDTYVALAVKYGLMKLNEDGSMPRIMNHLPFLRYRAIEPKQVKVEIGNEMRDVSSYWAEHPRSGSFMTKQRKHGDVPNWDMNQIKPEDLVSIKMKSMAQMFANHEELVLGGLKEAGQTIGEGGKPTYWIDGILNSIQDPEKRDYAVKYVNNMFGRYSSDPIIPPNVAAQLRRLQFYHLISGNMLTPLVNLTQTLFTYSKVSTSNWGKAWYMLAKNPDILEPGTDRMIPMRYFAEKYLGASGTFNKADEELLTSGIAGKIGKALSEPFRMSERLNQQHAAISGYLEGLSRNMPQEEAMQFGKNLNRITQQFGGRANTPELFRTPGMSLIGQFKSFQIGMLGLIKDMFTDAGQGLSMIHAGESGGMQKVMPLVKYLTAVGVLGGAGHLIGDHGSEAIRGAIRDQVGVELPKWTNNGMLGLLGVNLSNQIGMGALPATNNARDVFWFLPGPLVSHVLDAASVAMAMADHVPGLAAIPRTARDRDINFSPTQGPKTGLDLELSKLPQWGGMTPDTWLSKGTRSLPFAGPQLDKIRKWAKAAANGNSEVEAHDALQAVGWEIPAITNTLGPLYGASSPHGGSLMPHPVPATGTYIRSEAEQGPLEQAMGVPPGVSNLKQLMFNPQSRYEDIQRRAEEIESGQQYTAALRTYHSLMVGGQTDEAQAFAEQFKHRYGYGLVPSAAGIKAAWDRRLYPSTQRLERGVAWPLEVARRIKRNEE